MSPHLPHLSVCKHTKLTLPRSDKKITNTPHLRSLSVRMKMIHIKKL